MKSRLLISVAILLALFLAGCSGGGGGGSQPSITPAPASITPKDTIVSFTSVTGTWVPLETQAWVLLTRGKNVVHIVPVTYTGTTNDSDGRRIYFDTNGFPVGEGDSGSLVVALDGRQVGALAGGWSGNETKFFATAIEDERGILDKTLNANLSSGTDTTQSNSLRYTLRGVSKELFAYAKQAHPKLLSKFALVDSTPLQGQGALKPHGGGPAIVPLYSKTISAIIASGDSVDANIEGVITAPYRDKYLAFGHPFEQAGEGQGYPVYATNVIDFVSTANGSFKLGFPDRNQPIGALTGDHRFGVIIDPAAAPSTFSVDGTISVNGKSPVRWYDTLTMCKYTGDILPIALCQGVSNAVDAYDPAGSLTGTLTVKYKGTTQSYSINIQNRPRVISELYNQLYGDLVEYADNPVFESVSLKIDNFGLGLAN